MDRMCILTHSPSTMHHATTFSRSSAVPERPTASWGESTCTYDRWSIRPSRANRYPNAPLLLGANRLTHVGYERWSIRPSRARRYPNAPLLLGANRLTPLVYERPETVFWSESSSRAISYRRGAPQSFSGGRIKYLKFGTIFSEPALMAIGHHPRKHQNIPRSCLLGRIDLLCRLTDSFRRESVRRRPPGEIGAFRYMCRFALLWPRCHGNARSAS